MLLEIHQAFGWLTQTYRSSEKRPKAASADPGIGLVGKEAVASKIAVLKVIVVADEASAEVESEFGFQAYDLYGPTRNSAAGSDFEEDFSEADGLREIVE